MSSIDEFSAAIGAAAEAVESVITATSSAKASGDELSGQLAQLGLEGKTNQINAVGQRLESEALAAAAQLQELLSEIQQQAEATRGLQGAPRAGTNAGASSPAPPETTAPSPESSSGPMAPREIGGRLYSIHAQERMADPTRNVSAPEIERAITDGKNRPGTRPGTIDYYDAEAKIHVVTNTAGDVVTVRRQSRTPGWAR
ncbi:DUF4258 domain-containing protein [Glycomyces salinus]|uniref:DUF4258 domain-containing protein n=1 Tax=Glycomyces salinus TaxID=980294 RepID=UPI0018EB62C0|nr:DUF4258 domain-containing protein [Glycomyces salinus]